VLEVTQPTTRYKSFNEFARSSTIIQNPYYFIGVTGASGHYLVEERVVCSVIGFEFVSIFMVHSWDLITFIIIVQLMINAMSSNSSGIEAAQKDKIWSHHHHRRPRHPEGQCSGHQNEAPTEREHGHGQLLQLSIALLSVTTLLHLLSN
jgi:hypothetical protein